MSTSLFCSKAYQYTNAKTYVFSDSVLRVGKMGDDPIANWKNKIECYSKNNHFQDMNRIDGMPTEFEWKIFPGITTLQLCGKVTDLLSRWGEAPETFTGRILRITAWTWSVQRQDHLHVHDRIIFMSRGNRERCEHNSQTVAEHARRFPRGDWSFSGPRSEKKWYGTYPDKPDGSWDKIVENTMKNFSDSSHPIFRAPGAFQRRELKSKGGGKKSTHFNGSDENVELLLRTVTSASQLSVYGAIADLCRELSEDLGLRETWSTWSFGNDGDSHCSFCCRNSGQCTATWKHGARIRANIRTNVRRPEIVHTMFWSGLKLVEKRTILLCSWYRKKTTDATSMPRMHDASKWEEDYENQMDQEENEIRPSLGHKSLQSWWSPQYWSISPISIWRQSCFLG